MGFPVVPCVKEVETSKPSLMLFWYRLATVAVGMLQRMRVFTAWDVTIRWKFQLDPDQSTHAQVPKPLLHRTFFRSSDANVTAGMGIGLLPK